MKIYAICKVSAKSGKEYRALILERMGKQTFLTFDPNTICRAIGWNMRELYTMEVDKEYPVE